MMNIMYHTYAVMFSTIQNHNKFGSNTLDIPCGHIMDMWEFLLEVQKLHVIFVNGEKCSTK
jgi:hypothetical protein